MAAPDEETRALMSLLADLDKYDPPIPEELVAFYMERCGCNCTDPRLRKLVALATQKFLHDVVSGARSQCDRSRAKGRRVLQVEDVAKSLEELGVKVVKPAFFADNPV